MTYAKKAFLSLLCIVLVLMTATPAVTQAATTIRDVPTTNSKYKAISWAVDNDLFKLDSANNFSPNEQLTEQELVVLFAKLDRNYALSYNDSVAYNFYSDFYLPFNGTYTTANRSKAVTRGQFARIYAAFRGLDLDEPQAVQYLYTNDISTGNTGKKTFADFQPSTKLTRGDSAELLYRSVQNGNFAVLGLKRTAAGRDNDKITLPPGFMGSSNTEFEEPKDNNNDFTGPEYVNNALQSIDVEKPDLIANDQDSTLITVSLKACNGDPIPDDKSYTFRVTSSYGAKIVDTSGEAVRNVQSDGSTVSAIVIAPKLTKSVRDTISFELINNTDPGMKCLVGEKLNAHVRYSPQPEMRIDYQVYDPANTDDENGNVTPPYVPYEKLPEFFKENIVNVHWIDREEKLFSIGQQTNVTNALGNVENIYLQYGGNDKKYPALGYENAILQFENYNISVWLFEEIIEKRLKDSINDTIEIMYMISDDGRPIYRIQGIDDAIASQVENINPVGAIIQLMGYMPDEKKLTLEHYDSVMKIYAIFTSLSNYDRTVLLKYQGGKLLGQVEAYKKRVEALKESEEAASRPSGKDRYTKVMVTLVRPGGEIITDYQGTVKIKFDGVEKTASFVTNTSDYLNNTGSPGTAVAYFDSVIYGKSKAEATLVNKIDPRYATILKDLKDKTFTKEIFTNPYFSKNSCSLATEVAYVVDYSASMKASDQTNYRGKKMMEVINQIKAKNNIVIETNTKATVLGEGTTDNVLKKDLYKASKEKGATDIFAGIEMALSKFSNDSKTSKAIIVVSDGKTSKSKMTKVLNDAKNKGVKIYTVSMGKKSQVNDAILTQLAAETGGIYYHAIDNLQLHQVFQKIIDAILCKTSPSSCVNPEDIFEEATVTLRKGNITMNARIDGNCSNVAKVNVRFPSLSGDAQFELKKRSDNVYMLTKTVQTMQDFKVNNEIEFIAYDKDGKIIATKTTTITN
ncbi:aerotolerance regulator BatA [Lysinibacillus sphaericus]|uniref:S-layer homology domain-containing protein n=1 Tax=Lysinibacillus sphaericus TaxID=1421 RepID=UPI0018CED7DB|nr:S-layer homology domain-containing protein [Lysinibacillus sphaericus]MBG9453453.1 aerotolerance regulator BatA [Lysinibacillus sphaericus]MBG9480405.1 aerotolerance regulator BatA [Lysinibacillus sphaericus]MBG9595084.1 aerotolerance regulator BatA [Lysinibacillus sphaericus]